MDDKIGGAAPMLGQLEKKRLEDFVSRYANNVFLESTAWDLRMVFGQVDLAENSLLQHTSMTIPWTQVKILAYLLHLHLSGHERDQGRIQLFKDAVVELPAELPNNFAQSGVTPETWRAARELYEKFIAANPEVNPEAAKGLARRK